MLSHYYPTSGKVSKSIEHQLICFLVIVYYSITLHCTKSWLLVLNKGCFCAWESCNYRFACHWVVCSCVVPYGAGGMLSFGITGVWLTLQCEWVAVSLPANYCDYIIPLQQKAENFKTMVSRFINAQLPQHVLLNVLILMTSWKVCHFVPFTYCSALMKKCLAQHNRSSMQGKLNHWTQWKTNRPSAITA